MNAAIIAALLSLLVAGHLRAQSDHPKAFAGIAAGVAMPQGSFANKEVGEPGTGFAETGFTYNINAEYRFANNLALVAMAHSQAHNRNMQPIADKMNH